jgi:CRP-like cAMP-binding protein
VEKCRSNIEDTALAKKERVNIKNFLKGLSLFTHFPDKGLEEVLNRACVKHYPKGKMLFMVGDQADYFYILIDGWIKLFRETRNGHEVIITLLTNGEMFGRSAVIKNGTHPYSCEALTDLRLLILPSNFMLHMAGNHTDYDDFLNRFLESELNEHNNKNLEAEHLAYMTSAQRVGCFLLRMCTNRTHGSITFQLPYEKSLVAGRLGMTPETFSRSLNHLSSKGVRAQHSTITIDSIEELKGFTCEHCSATRKECFQADSDD